MDAYRLRSVIDLVIAEHRRHEIGLKFSRIEQALDAGTANPCAASDEHFRQALMALLTALREMRVNDFVESDRRIMAATGSNRLTGYGLAERVLEIANERPFLPGRARAAFVDLNAEIESRVQTLSNTQAGLRALGVEPVHRDDNAWELGILLPKRMIKGDLQHLLDELKEWDECLKELLPLFAAAPAEVSLRTHSTDRFELSMPLDRDGALALGIVVARVYEMFREVRANRDRAADLERRGYPSEIVSRLTGYEHQIVKKHLSSIKAELTRQYVRREAGKPKEIDRLLDKDLRFMAIKMREGVAVEIAGPTSAADRATAEGGHDAVPHHVRSALKAARQAGPQASFDQKQPDEPKAPHLPLSKVAESGEDEKKAA
jgi:hypothetical protein